MSGETNMMDAILGEGPIRQAVLKHLSLDDYKTMNGVKTVKDLSNEAKLDLVDQINDPTSAMNRSVHDEIRERHFDFVKWMFGYLRPEIHSRLGAPVLQKKINVNLVSKSYYNRTFLLTALYTLVADDKWDKKYVDFISFLIDECGADPRIPDGALTPLAYVLHKRRWETIKLFTKKFPLHTCYKDKKNYGMVKEDYELTSLGKQLAINDRWILRNFPISHIEWLLKHGGLKVSFDVSTLRSTVAKELETLEKEAAVLEEKIPKLDAKITKAKEKQSVSSENTSSYSISLNSSEKRMGWDTLSKKLDEMLFHLRRNRRHQDKLREELSKLPDRIEAIEKLL